MCYWSPNIALHRWDRGWRVGQVQWSGTCLDPDNMSTYLCFWCLLRPTHIKTLSLFWEKKQYRDMKQAAGAVPEHCSKTSWQILPKGDGGQGQSRLQKATEQRPLKNCGKIPLVVINVDLCNLCALTGTGPGKRQQCWCAVTPS